MQKRQLFHLLPGMVAGVFWPRVEHGLFTSKADVILVAQELGFKPSMLAIEADRDPATGSLEIPADKISEAIQNYPAGWLRVTDPPEYPVTLHA